MTRWRSWCLALAAGLALALASAPAHAQRPPDPVAQAKQLFNFGVRAYEAGQYRAAQHAFEKAYALTPRPGILFSTAQALRRQYALDHRPADLTKAVEYYRRYVDEVKEGGRRAEAAAALAELEPMAAHMDANETPAPEPDQPPAAERRGVIMLSTQHKSARVFVDGAAGVAMPLSAEVEPGKHKLRISARGFVTWEKEVEILPGQTYAPEVVLVAKPSRIRVSAIDGAEVFLDGRSFGDTPLGAPLECDAGRHRVAIVHRGRHAYVADLTLARGEERALEVALETTGQRYAAYALMGLGGGGIIAGGVFLGVALSAEGAAQDFSERQARQNVLEAERQAYEEDVSRRDDFRVASAVAFGAGGAVAVVGLLMFVFDAPRFEAVAPAGDEPRAPEPAAPMAPEVMAAPGADLGLGLKWKF